MNKKSQALGQWFLNPYVLVLARIFGAILGAQIVGIPLLLLEAFWDTTPLSEPVLIFLVVVFAIPIVAFLVFMFLMVYCPKCKWILAISVLKSMFVLRAFGKPYYCRRCEENGIQTRCY